MEEILKNKNITKPALFKILTIVGELRYVDFPLLKTIKNRITNYVCSRPNWELLLKRDLICELDNNSFGITVKSLNILKENGMITSHIQDRLEGNYGSHQQALTAYLYPVMWQEDYYLTFYYPFKKDGNVWLVPDAIIIFRNKETGNYRIEFLEIENTDKKEDLKRKSDKYKELASNYWVYNEWWRRHAVDFRLPHPEFERFCFGVTCIGKEQDGTIFRWESNL